MPRPKKKSSFTLIELFIAITLFGIISVFLFSHFKEMSYLQDSLKSAQHNLFERHAIQERLSFLFSKVPEKAPLTFSEEENILTFPFDNGIDEDPSFCNAVLGTLFLNEKNELILGIHSPKEGEDKQRLELLADNVEALSFSFFPPQENRLMTPEIVTLSLSKKKEKDPFLFSFFLLKEQSNGYLYEEM